MQGRPQIPLRSAAAPLRGKRPLALRRRDGITHALGVQARFIAVKSGLLVKIRADMLSPALPEQRRVVRRARVASRRPAFGMDDGGRADNSEGKAPLPQ